MKTTIFATILFLSLGSFAETEKPTLSYKQLRATAFADTQEMAVRWKALMDMTRMKKHESLIDLKKALTSKTWYMRNAALVAIESINPEMAFDIAKKQLSDPALVVRSAAVEVLTKNKSKVAEVRDLLWKEIRAKHNLVKSKSLWIRPQISQFLANDPLPSERENFLALTEEKDDEVRANAERALQKLQAGQ